MQLKKGVNFCDLHPACYAISAQKGIALRHARNLKSAAKIAKSHKKKSLPNLVYAYSCELIKRGPDIEPLLQENKAINIDLACKKIDGLVIKPGQTFSFWQTVGKPSKRKGYKEGRVIVAGKLMPGLGGGLCNLGNAMHLLALHSPVHVTELHFHSDALSPDHGERVPFSSGTSVSYNYIDFRFLNTTDQDVQIRAWCGDDERLHVELRSQHQFPWVYELEEEDHHFQREGGKYYRVSRIYRVTRDRGTNEVVGRNLIRNNHSQVMYDPSLIPAELLREPASVEVYASR